MSRSRSEGLHPQTFYDIQDDATWSIIRLLPILIIIYSVSISLLIGVGLAVALEGSALFIDQSTWIWILGGGTVAGVLLAFVHAVLAYIRPLEKMMRKLRADPLDEDDHFHQTFQNVVDEIRIASPVKKVMARVIPTARTNAMAMGDRDEAVVILTEGALGILRRDELQAVVAHEMAHISYGDARLKYFTANLVETFDFISANSLFGNGNSASDRQWGNIRIGRGSGRAGLAIVAIYLLSRLLKFINRLFSTTISQQREWRADATAIEYCRDPEALASALYKLGMVDSKMSSAKYTGPMEAFQLAVESPAMESLLLVPFDSAETNHQSIGWFHRLFQAHPPLFNRIEKCLKLAHSSFSNLRQRLKRKRTSPYVPVRALRDSSGHSLSDQPWYIRQNGETRQVSITQLLSGGILQEETPVARGGDAEWKLPDEHDQLHTLRAIYQTGSAGHMDCPECGVSMRRRYYLGVPLEACVLCGGVALPWKKLVRLESRYRGGDVPEYIEDLDQYRGYHGGEPIEENEIVEVQCPACRADFHARRFGGTGLVVDSCEICGLTWFEEDELMIGLTLRESSKDGEKS